MARHLFFLLVAVSALVAPDDLRCLAEDGKTTVTIPIRRHRLYPISGKVEDFSTRNFGVIERPFEFSPDDTAITPARPPESVQNGSPFEQM